MIGIEPSDAFVDDQITKAATIVQESPAVAIQVRTIDTEVAGRSKSRCPHDEIAKEGPLTCNQKDYVEKDGLTALSPMTEDRCDLEAPGQRRFFEG